MKKPSNLSVWKMQRTISLLLLPEKSETALWKSVSLQNISQLK